MKNGNGTRYLKAVLLCVVFVCLFCLGHTGYLSVEHQKDKEKLKKMTEEEFNDFYENIKAMSLYDTGVEAAYADTFLTLSTCACHVKDGRLVVVAKRVE